MSSVDRTGAARAGAALNSRQRTSDSHLASLRSSSASTQAALVIRSGCRAIGAAAVLLRRHLPPHLPFFPSERHGTSVVASRARADLPGPRPGQAGQAMRLVTGQLEPSRHAGRMSIWPGDAPATRLLSAALKPHALNHRQCRPHRLHRIAWTPPKPAHGLCERTPQAGPMQKDREMRGSRGDGLPAFRR